MQKTYYQAYQEVLESERRAKVKDVSNDEFVKPHKFKRTEMPKSEKHINRKYGVDIESEMEVGVHPKSEVVNPNKRFIGKFRSLYHNAYKKGMPIEKSGIFSMNETDAISAIMNGVPTNVAVSANKIPDCSARCVENAGYVDALIFHCLVGNDSVVKEILKNDYKPPRKYKGMNPLTAAVYSHNIEILKILLRKPLISAMVNHKDGFGHTPLMGVAILSHTASDPYLFAKVLTEAGATDVDGRALEVLINNEHCTPILFAEFLPVVSIKKLPQLKEMAEKLGYNDKAMMIYNFIKFGERSINYNVTHSSLIQPL